MKLKEIGALFKQSYQEWNEDKAARLGAALAYYAIFSLAPLLVIVVGVIGLVYSGDAVQEIQAEIESAVGADAARIIASTIKGSMTPAGGFVATLIGVVSLLLGASGVFGQLQDALNTIWEAPPKEGGGLLGMIKDRFLSFTMVLGVAFLLLISLVVSAGLSVVGTRFQHLVPGGPTIWQIVNLAFSLATITLLFAMIFKILPDVQIAWRDVWIGAALTALLFVIGKELLGFYLGRSGVGSAYGAAGSLLVILVWIYYSAQILFFGAEFTQVYANNYGKRSETRQGTDKLAAIQAGRPAIVPDRHAPVAPDSRRAAPRAPSSGNALVGILMMLFGLILGRYVRPR